MWRGRLRLDLKGKEEAGGMYDQPTGVMKRRRNGMQRERRSIAVGQRMMKFPDSMRLALGKRGKISSQLESGPSICNFYPSFMSMSHVESDIVGVVFLPDVARDLLKKS
jgi:hypothetical protein